MMGVGVESAKALTYWEYTAVVTEYARRQNPDAGKPPPPSKERVEAAFAKIPQSAFGGVH